MASVPSVTLDRVDLAVSEVAHAIAAAARRPNCDISDLAIAFRQFAEGVSILIGPVPDGAVISNGSTEETA